MPASSNATLAQIVALRNGLDPVLSGLQALLSAAYSQSLPVVGSQLSAAAAKGEQALERFQELNKDVAAALDALTDPAGYAAAEIEAKLGAAFAKAGFAGTPTVSLDPNGGLVLGLVASVSKSYSQPLGADFGIPNLSLATTGSADATIGYSVDLSATVDSNGTFAVANPAQPALNVTIDASAPTFTGNGHLQNLSFDAQDKGTSLHGTFAIDTQGHATFSGDAALGLHLTSSLGSAAFPSVSADLNGSWHFSNSAIDPANAATFGDAPRIEFDNVSYDLGSFFDGFLKPVLDKIAPVLQPIHNALAVLNTDLTFIKGLLGPAWHLLDVAGASDANGNDIGDGKVTLLDFIKAGLIASGHNATVGGLTTFLNVLGDVVNAAAFLDGLALGPASYDLGSFVITDDMRKVGFTGANAALQVVKSGADVMSLLTSLGGTYSAPAGAGQATVAGVLVGILDNPVFKFPILSPLNLFKTLLGGTADLFTLTPPPFTLGLGSINAAGAPTATIPIASFPIVPGVTLGLSGALQASADIGFGVDTKGLADYAAGGYQDPGKLLGGLYITNPLVNGVATPLLRVAGDIALGVTAGFPGASVGGSGDIGGDIAFSLATAGKAYLGPLLGQLASDPLAAFDATGRVTAGLNAAVSLLGIDVYQYHSPRLVLAQYSHQVTPVVGPPPTTLSGAAVTAIRGDAGVTTGKEGIGDTIRIVLSFTAGLVRPALAGNGPVLQLNDHASVGLDLDATKAAGGNQLVYTYTVSPADTSILTLGIQGLSGSIRDTNGDDVDLASVRDVEFAGVQIDTSAPRVFTAPTGLFDNQANFARQFVSVSAGGQDLNLYGNAIVNSGSVATFQQDSGDVTTLTLQPGSELDLNRGVLRINGGIKDSLNAGTISVGPAVLSLNGNLDNTGTLRIGAAAGTPTLTLLAETNRLYGGGQVTLSDSDGNRILGGPAVGNASQLPMLVNADNQITGAGTIGTYAPDGSSGLDFTNQGQVTASGAHQLRLLATTTNTGTLAGTGAGGLAILGTVDNQHGTISASGGGLVTLGDKADVTGGTLSTPGGTDTARFTTAGTAALHGDVALNADLVVGAGATLLVTGAILQSRYSPPGANGPRLSAGSGVIELDAAFLTDGLLESGAGGVVRVTGSSSLNGTGILGGSPNGLLTTASIQIDAGKRLGLAGALGNRGRVEGTGQIDVTATLDNAGGTLSALAGGSILLETGTTVRGGTLVASGTATIAAEGHVVLDGSAAPLNMLGTLHASAGASGGALHLQGTINQYGSATQIGEIIADNEDVTLDAATLQNGTMSVVGTGRFLVNGASILDGTSHGLNLPGAVVVGQSESLTIRGLILNAGHIALEGNSYGSNATLNVTGTATLQGGGAVTMVDTYGAGGMKAVITGLAAGDALDNKDNTISGYGELGAGRLGLVNEAAGTIAATAGTLRLFTGGTITNRGLLQAAGGTLLIENAVDNRGGRIAAMGNTVLLGGDGRNVTITGGTLSSSGAGQIEVTANGPMTLDGTQEAVTNTGTIAVDSGATLKARGTFANKGTLALNGNSYGEDATLAAVGTLTLQGGGSVTMVDLYGPAGVKVRITGATSADTLDNVDNRISGSGRIGDGSMTLINEAAGVIDATVGSLTIDTGAATVVNHGLLEAAGATLDVVSAVANSGRILAGAGGTLRLHKAVTGTGTLQAADGGTLVLDGAALTGTGSVSSTAGGTIVTASSSRIDGAAQTVSLAGALVVNDGATLTLHGPIANAGHFAVNGNSYGDYATLAVSGAATLSGGGSITLVDLYGPAGVKVRIKGASSADTLDNVDNRISGSGLIGAGSMTLVNEAAGVIDATAGSLTIDTGAATIVNGGLLEAEGATLDVASAVANSGRILAGAGGTVRLHKAVTGPGTLQAADGGTLALDGAALTGTGSLGSTASGTIVVASSSLIHGSAQAVSLAGRLVVNNGANLTLGGPVANTGHISIEGNSYGSVAALVVKGTATLRGGGTVGMLDLYGPAGMKAAITGLAPNDTLDNRDNAISGTGELGAGQLGLINEAAGTITAIAGTLRLSTGSTVTNRGLLQATSGTLLVESAIDNAGGRIAAAGGTVQLGGDGRAVTVAGGTLSGSGAGHFSVTETGAVTLDGVGEAVTSTAAILVDSHATVTAKGRLVNGGSIALNGNSYGDDATLAVSGTVTLSGGGSVTMLDQYGPAGIKVRIAGASTADTLDNVDNRISGYGRIGDGAMSLVNEAAGVIDATAGTLRIDTGGATILNRGLLEADAGTLAISSALANTGLINAKSGTVTLAGIGSGAMQVGPQGKLVLGGGMQADSVVSFSGLGGTVAIAAGPIAGTVRYFVDGDTLDIAKAGVTSSYADGVLTLFDGAATLGTLKMAGASATDRFTTTSDGQGGTLVTTTVKPDIAFTDVSTNVASKDQGTVYDGPVAGLEQQYIWTSDAPVAMAASVPNVFLHGGASGDALMAKGGSNVLDGGGGSNFLIGADGSDGGNDVFFVDGRAQVITWSTIVNFHPGDMATIFGFHPDLSTRPYTEMDGAEGYKGLTIHSELNGPGTGIKASMTFAGIDQDTAEKHFSITAGTLQAGTPDPIDYLLIQYNR